MADFIREAMEIIEDIIPVQFSHGDHMTIINNRAEAITATVDAKTKLYAVCMTGSSKGVNMLSPLLKRELKLLAQEGGGSRIIDDVRWQFIAHSGGTGTTTPITHLS